MEFIAIGIDKGTQIIRLENLTNVSNLVLGGTSIGEMDTEVREGVKSFAEALSLTIAQITTSDSKHKTSQEVSEDIAKQYANDSNSIFINFLVENKKVLPEKFYLIFAFEWHANDKVRFQNIEINQLTDYFTKNNSWYLWLYNYQRNHYTADLDVPLVLEVNNKPN